MANNLHGEVDVQDANGKTYTLRLGCNELIQWQNDVGLAGKDDEFWKLLLTGRIFLGVEKLRFGLHRALTRDGYAPTVEDAGNIITSIGMKATIEAINSALEWMRPSEDEKQKSQKGGEPRPSSGPTS